MKIHRLQVCEKLERVILNILEITEQLCGAWGRQTADPDTRLRNSSCEEMKEGLGLGHFLVMLPGSCDNDLKTFPFQISPHVEDSLTADRTKDNS